MANQPPPFRPLFRFGSQIRLDQLPSQPAPLQPTPAPMAPAVRPAFGRLQSFLPLNPQPTNPSPLPVVAPQPDRTGMTVQQSGPNVQTPPVAETWRRSPTPPQPKMPQTTIPAPATTAFRATVSPPESPKVIKPSVLTPPESPRMRMAREPPPPSPPLRRVASYSPPPTPPRSQVYPQPEPKDSTPIQKNNPHPSPPPTAYVPPPPPRTPPSAKKSEEPYSKKNEEDKLTVAESANPKSNLPKKKKPFASEQPTSALGLLTLTGENTGAYMELGGGRRHNAKSEPFVGRFHQLKEDHTAHGGSGNANVDDKDKKKAAAAAGPMTALVNSNVQGANNSILFNSTCVHGSPGVHIFLSSANNRHHRAIPSLKGGPRSPMADGKVGNGSSH